MTPEKVEKIMELVQLYGEARALRYHAQFGRPDMVPRLKTEESEALDDVRAALTALEITPEVRTTLDRYMHIAVDPYRTDSEQEWMDGAYSELRCHNALPDFLPTDRRKLERRRNALTAESEGDE